MRTNNIIFQQNLILYSDWKRVKFPDVTDPNNLHIEIKSPLQKKHYLEVVEFLSLFSNLHIRISLNLDNNYDLSILQYLPHTKTLILNASNFNDFNQFDFISENIEKLKLNYTSSKSFSFSSIERFKKLKFLEFEKYKKDVDSISKLENLEKLSINYVTLQNLDFLSNNTKLEQLNIKFGNINNLDALPKIENIKHLEFIAINKLANLDQVANTLSLKSVYFNQLPLIEDIESFSQLKNLEAISLSKMKRLKSLKWAADAPNLLGFFISETTHLEPSDFNPFLNHQSLQYASIYIGNKYSTEVRNLLNLPEPERINHTIPKILPKEITNEMAIQINEAICKLNNDLVGLTFEDDIVQDPIKIEVNNKGRFICPSCNFNNVFKPQRLICYGCQAIVYI